MRFLVFVAENVAVDVWPKFLEFKVDGVLKHLASPALIGLHPCVSGRIVSIADASSGAGPDDFGNVERVFTGIGPGDEDPAYRVTGALEETPVA